MFIETLIILFDLIFTVLITLIIPVGHNYHYWAPLLLLVAGYIIAVALMWIILWILALPYDKKKTYTTPSRWAQFWLTEALTYINNHARIKIIVENDIPLPKEKYLLVCNHRSKFDPMLRAQLYGKRHDLAFISKPTNFKIPLGGHFMKACCYLSIDRYDKLKSLEVMRQASDLISENKASIGVFPEGTRSEDAKLGPFHEGVFSIAKKTNCPIVIASIKGTENIHKNFPKRKTIVTIEILKILYPNEYDAMITKQISDYARDLMYQSLGQ